MAGRGAPDGRERDHRPAGGPQEHADHEEHGDHGEGPGGDRDEGWAAWLLLVAAAAPVLLAAEGCRRFLAGARDQENFGWRSGDLFGTDEAADGAAALDLADRWPAMLGTVPAGTALLASVVGLLALTGAALAGRPGWLAPGRRQRWAGVAVAVVVVLGALGLAAGSLVTVSRSGQDEAGLPSFVLDTWGWLEAGVPLGTALLSAVLAGLCGAVLLRTGEPPAAPVRSPAAGPAPLHEPSPEPEPQPRSRPEPRPEPRPEVAPVVPARRGERTTGAVEGPPRPSSEDLALYRRPQRVRGTPHRGGEAH
ncbi:hypothetical protein [Kineococcus arenarius]|uniref:hypothetical protein n=1 Tax=Kineococcus sp. SYSU DK007 TaxID=3383128 RepID=UPI003D7F0775